MATDTPSRIDARAGCDIGTRPCRCCTAVRSRDIALAVAAFACGNRAVWRMPSGLKLLLALVVVTAVLWQMGFRFGRDTGCALLAAMIAIKPAETSTLRDARSMVGFALFAPFSAFLLDQGPLTMLLGMVAVLSALLALQRLAVVESQSLAGIPAWPSQLRAVGKLVAIGLPLALSLFWLFPRLGSPLWGIPERAMGRPGLSEEMTPGEWLDLLADDRPAMRVEFHGPHPSQQQMYWRGPVLWDFDGRSWTQPRWLRGLPAKPFDSVATRWDYTIEFEPTDRRQLVALDLPISAPAGSFLSGDYGLYAASPLSSLTRWRLQSSAPSRFQPQLEAMLRQRALALPPGYNPRTLALARQWRSEAGEDDAAVVQRVLAWVTREFAYTLDAPLPGRDGVDEFLFDQKQGYCQHSLFLRRLARGGLPARVVTGSRWRSQSYRRLLGVAQTWTRTHGPKCGCRNAAGYGWSDRAGPRKGTTTRLRTAWRDLRGLVQLTRLGDLSDWMRRGWTTVLGFNADRRNVCCNRSASNTWSRRAGRIAGLFAVLALAWMGCLLARGEREPDPCCARGTGWNAARAAGLQREPHEPALSWARRAPLRCRPAIPCLRSASVSPRPRTLGRWTLALLNDLRRTVPDPRRSAMNTKIRLLALAAGTLLLGACATAPKPLQGSFNPVSPRDAVAGSAAGTPVRWGGRIVETMPGQDNTCFQLISRPLGSSGRPLSSAPDATDGRFIACRAGFYDPAVSRGSEYLHWSRGWRRIHPNRRL